MKKSILFIAALCMAAIIFFRCTTLNTNASTMNRTQLPSNPLVSCTIPKDSFSRWFVNGQPAVNGAVQPGNSVLFPSSDNCDFYQWSQQMFLWMTSPASGTYGGNSIVLESPLFFDVSPENADTQRFLIPHLPNHIFNMSAHLVKNGPERLPLVRGNNGKMYEVEPATPADNNRPQVSDAGGNQVLIYRIETSSNGTHRFYDAAGKEIPHPKAILTHRQNRIPIIKELIAGTTHAFVDTEGNEVNFELGQATGDVLMSQTGSLVYYLTMVNDVYAWYLTASKNNYISGQHFPVTAADRDSICTYARVHNKVLPDSNALAIEIKSSWVEASSIPPADLKNYITVNATIPIYKKTASFWVPDSTRQAKMALVGIHVVGSVAHHPEMVWATFEHVSNSPNAAYTYVDVNKNVQTVPADNGSGWLFSSTGATADTACNRSHMTAYNPNLPFKITDTIFAQPNYAISPSNTNRTTPWGSVTDSATNQQDLSSAASNSEIISFDNNIQSFLPGDTRSNYLLIGATWTFGGTPPNGGSYGSDTTHGVAIGTSALANTTMETYFQNNNPPAHTFTQTTCFLCHSNNNSNLPGDLSHIYTAIQKMFLDPVRSLRKK